MRRYTLLILTLALAMTFTTANAQKKSSKTKKKTEKVVKEEKSEQEKLRDRANKGDAEAMLTFGKACYYGVDSVKVDYKKAAEWFLDAAEADTTEAKKFSAEAKAWLAVLYYNGLGVTQNNDRAKKLFAGAVKGGFQGFDETTAKDDVNISRLMYECYNTGVGVKRNTNTAAIYQRLAADAGDEDSYMPVALYLYNNDQQGESFKYFEKAALKDDIRAAYFYGLMLYDGHEGVEQDKPLGRKYLQKAADAGHMAANLKLGEAYLYGNGVEKDKEKGAKMIKVAAEKGNNKAMWILANCYRLGEGIDKNYALAAQWMALVASANKTDEYNNLIDDLKSRNDPFYSYLKGLYEYNVTGNYSAAIDQFKVVEKAKIAEGITMQGVVLTNKNYKKRNMKNAAKMFNKAADDSPLASYYLAYLMENGEGVKKDEKGALEMLTKAADDGCAAAQCRLADKYLKGSGVGMDVEKAAKYYLLAEAQHALTPDAAKQLANLYEKGIAKLPETEDLKSHVDKLRKTKENNSLIKMLASTKF